MTLTEKIAELEAELRRLKRLNFKVFSLNAVYKRVGKDAFYVLVNDGKKIRFYNCKNQYFFQTSINVEDCISNTFRDKRVTHLTYDEFAKLSLHPDEFSAVLNIEGFEW